MKWFMNKSIKVKFIFGFGSILLLMMAITVTTWISISSIINSQNRIFYRDFVEITDLHDLKAAQNRARALILEISINRDPLKQQKLEEEIEAKVKEVDLLLKNVSTYNQGDEKALIRINSLSNLIHEYRKIREQQLSLIKSGRIEDARNLSVSTQNSNYDEIYNIIVELENGATDMMKDLTEHSTRLAKNSLMFILFIGITSIIAAIALVILLSKFIAVPLARVTEIAVQIAKGDLTGEIAVELRNDEIGTLLRNFQEMTETLGKLTHDITEGVEVLSSSATEIVTTTAQVAAGASETATAVTETTTTVEEVRQTAQLAENKARTLQNSAQKVSEVVQTGKQAMVQTVEGMGKIRNQMKEIADIVVNLSEQSQTIGEITATVNDIADQSNLLAVNASIEAVKAGEQGMGFSVVAQEIKNLAEQSKRATSQVRTILNDIQKGVNQAVMATEQGTKAVEAGSILVERGGETIDVLADSVKESNQASIQIVTSSQQQLAGMDQIAPAMENIKQAMMQNVASTEQSQKAAQNLHDLGQRLKELVGKFRLKG